MKKKLMISIILLLTTLLAACGSDESQAEGSDEGLLSDGKLTVGISGGSMEEIMEVVQELGEEEGLEIEIKTFSDYVMPNVALSEGELDLNAFQTEPFFDQMNEERGLGLVKVADTYTAPMGVYSEKIEDLDELEDGAKIGLPSDPTNSGRALQLFEEAGLIKVDEEAGLDATIKDIVENEHNYDFVELEAAQVPRQLGELDVAAINSNFAIEHGLSPADDAIYREGADSPFANLIAVREESKDEEVVQQFIDLFQSDEVKEFIEENFEGSLLPAW